MKVTALHARFTAKTDSSETCHRWHGFIDKAGYGRIRLGGRDKPVGYAHRVSYEMAKGPIPEGLHIDHLCRNRWCVNPDHLEVVTSRENMVRGVNSRMRAHLAGTCEKGHDMKTAYIQPSTGRRFCRECRKMRSAK